jgi:hypothetical protein
MDPLRAWKDDFEREVEEVLAGRARARERGEQPPEESFGFAGRLTDLVIPPAGTYAELREAQKNLELARAEILELRERVDVRQRALERAKESRERLKDGITRLALAVREERAAREMAQEEVKKAWDEMEAAKRFLASTRIDADYADARAEDWEREALTRQRTARDLQARFEQQLLDSDVKDAEMASLQARLAAAKRRVAEEAANDPVAIRLEQEKRDAQKIAEAATAQCERAMSAERTANARVVMLEDELRLKTALTAALESKANEFAVDAARVREEKAAVERKAREEKTKAQEEKNAGELKAQEEKAALERKVQEEKTAIELQLREEKTALERELREEKAVVEREKVAVERKLTEEKAVIERELQEEKSAVESKTREVSQNSYREGVDAARKRVENMERDLADARRAGAEAQEKERKAVEALTTLRVQIRMKMEKLLAATLDERDRKDKAIADLLRAEATAMERVALEKTHRESILEEERAKMRASFEDQRAQLEKEMDAERDAMRKRWQEQAEAFEKLRKEIEGGRKEG